MSLNTKFSYLAENSKFSRSNSYFSILTPTFLRDGFLNSYFQNPSENSVNAHNKFGENPLLYTSVFVQKLKYGHVTGRQLCQKSMTFSH